MTVRAADMTPPPPVPLERAWVARARRGDAQAFASLFQRCAAGVRRFLMDLLRDEAIADEATQETFVRAHARLESLKDDAKVMSWLLGIGRMVAWEQLRARRRLASSDDRVEDVDSAPTPEARVLGAEADRHLADAVATLSAERRAALLMRVDHGLAYEEIAESMGWSLQKVKNEIHRARLQLRAALASYLGGQP